MSSRVGKWLVGATLVCGCSYQDVGPTCLEECGLCTMENPCPPDRCGILVIMEEGCAGEVEVAEVAVDQCLEPEKLAPGKNFITCATVPKGSSRQIVVRSEDWVWKTTVPCPPAVAGSIVPVAVYCLER